MQSIMLKLVNMIAPQMRAPEPGLGGFLAEKFMEFGNPPSIRKGVERLAIQESDRVIVELGSGHGVGIREICAAVARNHRPTDDPAGQHHHRVVAVEISDRFRSKLKQLQVELGEGSFELFDADAKNMPFLADNSVDKIFAMNVVYFLDPLDEYLKEIYRVLKPNGTIVFGCKFAAVRGAAPPFVNTEPAPILDAMRAKGFVVSSEMIELGSPIHSYVEIKGIKQNTL
jgi:ubiquinone/menaquinone biosynthesis C-methylase UbiE